jgi:hypothetical protein
MTNIVHQSEKSTFLKKEVSAKSCFIAAILLALTTFVLYKCGISADAYLFTGLVSSISLICSIGLELNKLAQKKWMQWMKKELSVKTGIIIIIAFALITLVMYFCSVSYEICFLSGGISFTVLFNLVLHLLCKH